MTLKIPILKKTFEMWNHRIILKIPRQTDHMTNRQVLDRLSIERELLYTIKIGKTSYTYILRNHKYLSPTSHIPNSKLLVKPKDNAELGEKMLLWIRNTRYWRGLNDTELIKTAENREKFSEVTANIR